ncbi:hypothetical protein EC988_001794 [Linderina pennispora]|nr:hypothetical protein EC988_001794 [Linderina pennispora]
MGRQIPTSMMSPHGPPGGLAHAPPSSAPASMTHHMLHQRSATPGSSKLSPPGQQSYSQLKLEKNRFQANIRAFVDQHFMSPGNTQWDYQQSFKSPRNAQVTQQIVHAFYNAHGGTVERIEHGLSVYFSSLKAKHRTTEDKALLKQQRDRRRARRIKKAAGRRKVFDRTQYPFLPNEFDPNLAFVPSAMSPEHTDDDGEVKVGTLEWRTPTYTKLFKLLDTLRPKRTPRPNNPHLKGCAAPPPEIPSIMIDPAYAALDRVAEEQHDMDEDESDEDADSHAASMYM